MIILVVVILLQQLGIDVDDGVVRLSMTHYNNIDTRKSDQSS